MSSCVHLGSHPPLLALIIRPGQDERHTLANILARGCFTLNHVNSLIVEQAHQTAARYPAQVSEFDATGLDEHWEPGFDAPFVAQAHVRIGLTLREHQTLAVNDTHLVIGQVALVFLPDNSLRSDGSLDLGSADTVALSGLDSYYLTALHRRMAYAKPDLPPRAIHPDNGELL
jgi:flavin reductase (DIM6/NTAB) family NADH-FMN oxidoreductase RutF